MNLANMPIADFTTAIRSYAPENETEAQILSNIHDYILDWEKNPTWWYDSTELLDNLLDEVHDDPDTYEFSEDALIAFLNKNGFSHS